MMSNVSLNLQGGTVNLPFDSYLKDCRVTLYGGLLKGVETLNISLDGTFTVYPPVKHNASSSTEESTFSMNSITILDGGLFDYKGDTANDNKLNIFLDGSLHIRGGGIFQVNSLYLEGKNEECTLFYLDIKCSSH